MARYIRKLPRIGQSLGPSEERGFELWVGYETDPMMDAEANGLLSVDDWEPERLAQLGVTSFKKVSVEDVKRWRR